MLPNNHFPPKWGHLYRPCTLVALSSCVTRSVNNSKSTNDTKNVLSIVSMFMCRQTGNLWYKVNQKSRKKKVVSDVLMPKCGKKRLLHLI
jgi:hypothetical protein